MSFRYIATRSIPVTSWLENLRRRLSISWRFAPTTLPFSRRAIISRYGMLTTETEFPIKAPASFIAALRNPLTQDSDIIRRETL